VAAGATILIIAKEEIIAALMGALVELSGFRPVFPAADERPLDAIARAGAQLVLLDCEHEVAAQEDIYRRADDAGSRVLLFSAARTARELELFAGRWSRPSFALPLGPAEFQQHLEQALEVQH
jgi:DNA-binding NtrC family response regulator